MLKPPRFNAYYPIEEIRPVDGEAWRLEVAGLVENKRSWTRQDLAALPEKEIIIRHICVEGWDYIGQWSGVPLRTFLERIGADLKARYVSFKTADDYPSSIDMATALHPQTLLATRYARETLPDPFGYPCGCAPRRSSASRIRNGSPRSKSATSIRPATGRAVASTGSAACERRRAPRGGRPAPSDLRHRHHGEGPAGRPLQDPPVPAADTGRGRRAQRRLPPDNRRQHRGRGPIRADHRLRGLCAARIGGPVAAHVGARTGLVLADGTPPMPAGVQGFGRCLLHAIRGMLARGHAAACVLSSDSPTLPTRRLIEAAEQLLAPGDRAVLGASDDGGYYLLGLKAAHAEMFADIAWSTDSVAAATRARARAIGLPLVELDPWYDVDDDPVPVRADRRDRRLCRTGHAGAARQARTDRAPRRPSGPRMNAPLARLTGLGLLLALLMLGALMLHVPGADTVGSPERANVFVGILALGVGVYLLAVRLVLRTVLPPCAFWIIVGIALVMRAALLPALPFLSSDIYRYVWDGQVQAAGINPYRYLPVDPALAHLRDPAVFPWINRATYALTIYPPAAQAVFALVGMLTPTVFGMKLAMVGFEALALLCLLGLLSLARLPRERSCSTPGTPSRSGPSPATAMSTPSPSACSPSRSCAGRGRGKASPGRCWRRPFWSSSCRWRPRPPSCAAAGSGGRCWPASPSSPFSTPPISRWVRGSSASCPPTATRRAIAPAGGLAAGRPVPSRAPAGRSGTDLPDWRRHPARALAFRIARGPALWGPAATIALCRDTAILIACTTAAANPHYAWYYAWLALPAVVAPIPAVVWLSAAPVLFYVDPFDERFFWPGLVFGPAIALALRDLLRARTVTPIPSPEGQR